MVSPSPRGLDLRFGLDMRFRFALASLRPQPQRALTPPSDGGAPDGATAAGLDSGVSTAPSERDDFVFCNGTETGEPGSAHAGRDGGVPGEPPCADGKPGICAGALLACVDD